MFRLRLVVFEYKFINKKCQQLGTYSFYKYCLTEKYDYCYDSAVVKLNFWQRQFKQHLACIKNIPPGYFLNLF